MDLGHFKTHNKFRRTLTGGVCEAHAVFLDEIFKSNAAVLNLQLTMLEERQYADQSGTYELPLRMVVSASNEFPQDESLGALYDRFLFRDRVQYIADRGNKRALLMAKASVAKKAQKFVPPCTITVDEWDAIAESVDAVTIPGAMIDKLLDFCDLLAKDGIVLSDRRSVKVLRALKAAAWLDGDSEVGLDALQVLRFCAWDTPEEQEKVLAACKTLDRSSTRKALDLIDGAIRTFRNMPQEPVARRNALGEVLVQMQEATANVKAMDDAGQFSKRGQAKVHRRMRELAEAGAAIKAAVRL
jgi:MoxR-like ATPase